MPRTFWHPGLSRRLVIGDAALAAMQSYRQGIFQSEAGGLLFALIRRESIHVIEATTPGRKDKRGTEFFEIDLQSAQAIIDERFEHGLNYVGEWHTHPQDRPVPSKRDHKTIASAFSRSRHDLEALVLVIVGRQEGGRGLWVGLHNEKGFVRLCEASTGPSGPSGSSPQGGKKI